MRYYCKSCESELILSDTFFKKIVSQEKANGFNWKGERLLCDFCTGIDETAEKGYPIKEVWMYPIPDFETLEQYLERTGKEWNGGVWYRYKVTPRKWSIWKVGSIDYLINIDIFGTDSLEIICAQSPNPPPDNWK